MSKARTAAGYNIANEDLFGLVQRLINRREYEPPPIIYHFTRAAAFIEIVKRHNIWATHYQHLNDRMEYCEGLRIARETFRAAMVRSGKIPARILELDASMPEQWGWGDRNAPYIASFSARGNLLSQWRAYADNGAGHSIGLETAKLPFCADIHKCQYGYDKLRKTVKRHYTEIEPILVSAIDKIFPSPAPSQRRLKEEAEGQLYMAFVAVDFYLRELATYHKPVQFKEENEWRLVVIERGRAQQSGYKLAFRAGPRGIIPYYEVPLVKPRGALVPLADVIVGPTQEPEIGRAATSHFLRQMGYRDAQRIVRDSDIPYRG